jgi:hypothetical protein
MTALTVVVCVALLAVAWAVWLRKKSKKSQAETLGQLLADMQGTGRMPLLRAGCVLLEVEDAAMRTLGEVAASTPPTDLKPSRADVPLSPEGAPDLLAAVDRAVRVWGRVGKALTALSSAKSPDAGSDLGRTLALVIDAQPGLDEKVVALNECLRGHSRRLPADGFEIEFFRNFADAATADRADRGVTGRRPSLTALESAIAALPNSGVASNVEMLWWASALEASAEVDESTEKAAGLHRLLVDLSLVPGATPNNAAATYLGLFAARTEAVKGIVADFLSTVRDLIATGTDAIASVAAPPTLAEVVAGSQMRTIALTLSDATSRYAGEIEQLLTRAEPSAAPPPSTATGTAPLHRALHAARERVASCRRHVERQELLAALKSLADDDLPVAGGWLPSTEYRSACAAAVDQMRELEAQRLREVGTWVADIADRMESQRKSIEASLSAAARRCIQQREEIWTGLRASAGRLLADKVETLMAARPADNINHTVKGSITANVAAVRLTNAAAVLVPSPGKGGKGTAAERLGAIGRDLGVLDRNSTLWKSTSELLSLEPAPNAVWATKAARALARVADPTDPAAVRPLSSTGAAPNREHSGTPTLLSVLASAIYADLGAAASPVKDWAGVVSIRPETLRAYANPLDPHQQDRVVLNRKLIDCHLVDGARVLPGAAEYHRLQGDYDERFSKIVAELSTNLIGEVERRRRDFVSSLPSLTGFEDIEPVEFAKVVANIRGATAEYAEQIAGLLSAFESVAGGLGDARVRTLHEQLAAMGAQVSECNRHLDAGDPAAALLAVTDGSVPMAASWQPSQDYRSVCDDTGEWLRDAAKRHRTAVCEWTKGAGTAFERCKAAIQKGVESAVHQSSQQREKLWTTLEIAGLGVASGITHQLASVESSLDERSGARAQAALSTIDGLAAANLYHAATALVPDTSELTGSSSSDDQITQVGTLFSILEYNSIAWAAADGTIAQAALQHGVGSAAVSQALLGLTGLSDHLVHAGLDVLAYVQGSLPNDIVVSLTDFVQHAQSNILPNLSSYVHPHDGLLLATYHAAMGAKGTLLGKVLLSGFNPEAAFPKYLEGVGQHSVALLANHAWQSSNVQAAVSQLHAAGHSFGGAQLAAASHSAGATHAVVTAMHGVLGHVPVVTLVLATAREVRLRRQHDISVQQSVVNVAVQVAGAGAGLAAAATTSAIAGLHGGPAFFVTVPLAMAGGIGGALALRGIKKRRFAKAYEQYQRVQGDYDEQFSQLVAELSTNVIGEVERHRRKFVSSLPSLTRFEDVAPEEFAKVVANFRGATAQYAERIAGLLSAFESVGGGLGVARVRTLREQLAAMGTRVAECNRHLAVGEPAAALLALTDGSIPMAASWRPSEDYRSICDGTGEWLQDAAKRHRAAICEWTKGAGRAFERCKADIQKGVEAAVQHSNQEREAAAAPVAAALSVVEREAAILGMTLQTT